MTAQPLTIPFDGTKNLHAWTIKQPSPAAKLAVLMPGYLDSKDYPHLVGLGDELAEQGYDVVCFNPYGTWETVDQIQDFTVQSYVSNVDVAIDFMEQDRKYAEIVLCGHSMGGMISMLYAAENKRESLKAAVAVMSPYAFIRMENYQQRVVEWGAAGYRDSERVDPTDPTKKFKSRVPFSFVENSQHFNLLETMPNVHVPVLFVAGEKDDLITPDHVRKVFEKANEPKEYVVVEGAIHNYREDLNMISTVNQIILKFLSTLSPEHMA